jgi:hypothetical protein
MRETKIDGALYPRTIFAIQVTPDGERESVAEGLFQKRDVLRAPWSYQTPEPSRERAHGVNRHSRKLVAWRIRWRFASVSFWVPLVALGQKLAEIRIPFVSSDVQNDIGHGRTIE